MPKRPAALTLVLSAVPSEIRLIQAHIRQPGQRTLAGFITVSRAEVA